MNYFYTAEPLAELIPRRPSGGLAWEACGFDQSEIVRANRSVSQFTGEDGEVVSIYPIRDEEAFARSLGELCARGDGKNRVLAEEEGLALLEDLRRREREREEERRGTPTGEEMAKAQELLLLGQIKNLLGGLFHEDTV